MTDLSALRVRVRAGDGVVARYDGVLLVVPAVRPAQEAPLDQLLQLCDEAARAGTRQRLPRRVAGLLVAGESDDLPPFALLIALADDVTAVLVTGDVDVVVRREGTAEEQLSGRDSPTWVDRLVHGAQGFDVRAGGEGGRGGFPARSALVSGVVAGSAVEAVPAGPAADSQPPVARERRPAASVDVPSGSEPGSVIQPAAPSAAPDPEPATGAVPLPVDPLPLAEPVPAANPAPSGPWRAELVQLSDLDDDEAREPLPTASTDSDAAAPVPDGQAGPRVQGILCPLMHLNDPRGLFCNICGRSLVHVTHVMVEGSRPSLGVLVLDDATVYSLDADYVIGREPELDEGVAAGRVRPLRLGDEDDVASRVHAEVRLSDWDVIVEDRGSANGTYLAPPDSERWEPLTARTPVSLQPGSRVRVGHRILQFESRHYR